MSVTEPPAGVNGIPADEQPPDVRPALTRHDLIVLDEAENRLRALLPDITKLTKAFERVELEQYSSTSNGLESSRVVSAGQARLWGFSGTNTKTSAQFILAFDASARPANGTAPVFVMTAQASSDFWVAWTPAYRLFREGIVLCNSSTAATLTIGSADCWFDAQYTPYP